MKKPPVHAAHETDFDYEAQLYACAQGEQAALRRLYDQEARWLLGVAFRIVRRRELADEVLHDAFLKIWHKSATYNATLGSAKGWIYSVVRNQALNAIRAQQEETGTMDDMVDDRADEGPGPLELISKERQANALHQCLERLDEQKRACIMLAYIDGYSQSQIAGHLACPLGTVKAWTRRGLLALKECLS